MSINIIDNFSVNVSKPIDARMVVANLSARMAITYTYDGLKVFQQDDRKTYVFNSGTSTWVIENNLDMADGYVPRYDGVGLTNSAIYSTASYVGINTNDPKEAFQINNPLYPIGAEPITFDMQFADAIMAYNWYYDGSDQTFNSAKGSSKLTFGNGDFKIDVRKSLDPNGAFTNAFYISDTGNIGIDTSSIYTINGSSTLFTGQTAKLEIITGDATGGYTEFMVLRHPTIDGSYAIRSLGYLMKLSSETNTTESAKMGGMMLESDQGASNDPSLYLLTGDQKRLKIDSTGNVSIQGANKYLYVPDRFYIGNSTYPVLTESEAIAYSSYVGAFSGFSNNPSLKLIDVSSFAFSGSTIQIEATFTGRLQFYTMIYPGVAAISSATKIVALFKCDIFGNVTPVGSPSVIFAQNDNAYMDFNLGYGSIDYSTPGYLNLLGGLYTINGGFTGQSYNIYEMVDYSIRVLY